MHLIKYILLIVILFIFNGALSARPNIIIILADDLGYGDVSYHGTLKETTTPHIDSIAHNGVWFQNGYSAAPVCGPSRAGLITGRYQQRFGYFDNIGPFTLNKDTEQGLPLNQKLISRSEEHTS